MPSVRLHRHTLVLGAFSEETTQRIRANITKNTPLKAASKPEDIADARLFSCY